MLKFFDLYLEFFLYSKTHQKKIFNSLQVMGEIAIINKTKRCEENIVSPHSLALWITIVIHNFILFSFYSFFSFGY